MSGQGPGNGRAPFAGVQSRARAAAKTGIRRVTRRLGYELVPVAAGMATVQRDLLDDDALVVIDVGANVGQYGERLRDLGFGGRIVSFEPGGSAYKILTSHVGGRWEARNLALGEAVGTSTLQVAGNSVSSSLLPVTELHRQAAPNSVIVSTEEVRVSTLDDEFAADADSSFFLKLDVQGLELPVLRGGARTLERTRAVQVEVSFDTLYDGQSSWLELCGFLQDLGFVVRYVEPGYEDASSHRMLQADLVFVRP